MSQLGGALLGTQRDEQVLIVVLFFKYLAFTELAMVKIVLVVPVLYLQGTSSTQ